MFHLEENEALPLEKRFCLGRYVSDGLFFMIKISPKYQDSWYSITRRTKCYGTRQLVFSMFVRWRSYDLPRPRLLIDKETFPYTVELDHERKIH